MNTIKSLLIGLTLALISASSLAESDVCAPFKDGVVDTSVISKMLAAADDGHLYRIDTTTSRIGFCVDSPVGVIEGEFKAFTGGLTYLQEHLGSDDYALVRVNAASLETDGFIIENMLKGERFFDVENYPEILFVSTGFEWVSETEAVLLGKLTIHGVTREVGFHVELIEQPGDLANKQRILVTATTLIRRSEFGLNALSPMVSDAVNLCMSVDAVKYAA